SSLWPGSGAALSLAIDVVAAPVETAADIERFLGSFTGASDGGLLLPPDVTTITHRDLIVPLAAKHRLPAVYSFRLFVVAGGLMSYGTDQIEMFGQTASYIDRILRGRENPPTFRCRRRPGTKRCLTSKPRKRSG